MNDAGSARNAEFQGNHKHVFDHIQNLSNQIDDSIFNDQTSWLVVLEESWPFFKDWQWRKPWLKIVGRGVCVTISEALGANAADDLRRQRLENRHAPRRLAGPGHSHLGHVSQRTASRPVGGAAYSNLKQEAVS